MLVLNLAALALVLTLLSRYWVERRALRAFVRGNLLLTENVRARALDLAGFIHATTRRRADPPFIPIPALDILGATPGTIQRQGGCCSGITRLYITGLETLGITATHVILYHSSGAAQHCLAEVRLGDEWVVVDPLYGFYYVDSEGGQVSVEALRRGVKPRFQPLPLSLHETYPHNSYYDFVYPRTKTANWTKTKPRRLAYRVLELLTWGGIDTFRRPHWMEWPQVVVAVAVSLTVLLLNLLSWLDLLPWAGTVSI